MAILEKSGHFWELKLKVKTWIPLESFCWLFKVVWNYYGIGGVKLKKLYLVKSSPL